MTRRRDGRMLGKVPRRGVLTFRQALKCALQAFATGVALLYIALGKMQHNCVRKRLDAMEQWANGSLSHAH